MKTTGGGLTLVVFESEEYRKLSYLHTGYEYNPGQLTEDISALKAGSNPAEWDGNELENSDSTDFEFYFPWSQKGIGWEVIADNDGIYPDKMGAAGRYEFITYRLIGRTWKSLSEKERENLLIGAICTDAAEGNTVKNGDGTVDFINGLSIPGKIVDGEIFIEPNAIIYNSAQ